MKKLTIEALITQLKSNGIDLTKWGKGEAKTVEDLFREIESGETELTRDVKGKLIRKILGVGADVYYTNGEKTFRLKEQKQVFADGRERKRDFGRAVSGKIKFGETARDAIIREIEEELGIKNNYPMEELETLIDTQPSQSYPGLSSFFMVDVFKINLTRNQFKPEGYVEEENGLTTYFIWEEIK